MDAEEEYENVKGRETVKDQENAVGQCDALEDDVSVEVRRTDTGAAVCALAGDLDIETMEPAELALAALLGERPPVLVVALQGVGFCDSSGLNLLLRTRTSAAAAGTAFRLAEVPPTVMRVLELTGARSVFALHATVEEALAPAP
ncbi:STAS domain-containing protein [Streptomyces sp. NPDC089919]|uniref:STAS domain-containing protein n=1 Tax=Streptomyces sp. NPDC089919 TaxID=3155188 RepID=UPI00342BC0C0